MMSAPRWPTFPNGRRSDMAGASHSHLVHRRKLKRKHAQKVRKAYAAARKQFWAEWTKQQKD